MKEVGLRYLTPAELKKFQSITPEEMEEEFRNIESSPWYTSRAKETEAIMVRKRKKFWKNLMKLGTYTGPLKPEDLADISSDEGVDTSVLEVRRRKRVVGGDRGADTKYGKTAEEATLNEEREKRLEESIIQTV